MSGPPAPDANTNLAPPKGEGSLTGRFVAILTPFFAVAAGWLSGVVADNVPGVKLDKGEIVAFMVAVATSVITAAWKWLEGLHKHEQYVANDLATPIREPPPPKPARTRTNS
jgi:hypothetical protein